MKKGVSTTYGKRSPKDDPVDHRFAELINELRSRKWPVLIQLTDSQIASELEVSRTTILQWGTGKNEISKFTAARFLDESIWTLRGYFSHRATEIHRSNLHVNPKVCLHRKYKLGKKRPSLDVTVLTRCSRCGEYYNMFQ